jgi:hypothetical protein
MQSVNHDFSFAAFPATDPLAGDSGLQACVPCVSSQPDTPIRQTIMMVDDEKLNIYVVAEHLRSAGYHDFLYTDDQ